MDVPAIPLDFDAGALLQRYKRERERRLGRTATIQYAAAEGEFVADPFAGSVPARSAVHQRVDVLIVGGGFSGLLVAAQLRKLGVDDFRMVDRAGDFGGTWYWNRYPGAACDIESYIYLPLLDECGAVPDQKFPGQPVLLAHSRAIGERFDLYPRALFHTEVTDLSWSEAEHRWVARTDRGDELRARFAVVAAGPMNKPKLPNLPGIDTFGGRAFHTSRWDYDYTGGSYDRPLDRLGDKRVGVVGTGATAVQCVPPLGESAEHLYVFQRTPSTVDARDHRATNPEWVASLQAGWQAERQENFERIVSGLPVESDLVADGRTHQYLNMARGQAEGGDVGGELADLANMERIRRRIASLVDDPTTAEALKPYYPQLCKRPCFQDGYLETFNRPNVTLVDTLGQGIERVTPHGVVAAGREYRLDMLVFATGFEVQTEFSQRVGFDTHGRAGQTLRSHWAGGVRTLFGIHAHGFPNCFVMAGAQAPPALNFNYVLTRQAQHLARLVRRCLDDDVLEVEATAEGEQSWLAEVLSFAAQHRAFGEACTPGYLSVEGDQSLRAVQDGRYGIIPTGSAIDYFAKLAAWEREGTWSGMRVTHARHYPARGR